MQSKLTLDDFLAYVSVLNDRFSAHWKFINEDHPAQWPLEFKKDVWIKLLVQFLQNNQQGER